MSIFSNKRFKTVAILLLIAAGLSIIIALFPQRESISFDLRIREAEKKLFSMQGDMEKKLEQISLIKNTDEFRNFFLITEKEKKGFSFYIIDNNKLQFWSDNEPAISDLELLKINNNDFLHLSNGDFLSYTKTTGAKKIIGLILLKHSYEYENKYLVNDFNPALGIGDDFTIAPSGDTLHLPDNRPGYFLKHDENRATYTPNQILWLYLIIALLLLVVIFLIVQIFSKSIVKTVLFILIIFGLRSLMIYFKIPVGLYNHGIFSPAYYASSFYFHSLGDMLLNASLLLVISICYYLWMPAKKANWPIFFIVWVLSCISAHLLIRGLVINSKISFELNLPADINEYSLLGFISFSILLLSFLFITAAFLKSLFNYKIAGRHAWIGISACAIYMAIILNGLNCEKEQETRKLIAQKAEMRQDHVAEYLFREQEEKIMTDTAILGIIHNGKEVNEKLSSFISAKYFNGYLSKFDLVVQVYDKDNTTSSETTLDSYYKESQGGKTTYSDRLFFLNKESGATTYLAILPYNEPAHEHTLVLTMTARFLHSAKGFPELFLSSRYTDNSPSDEYSIARYSGQSLLYEYGNYIYPLSGKEFLQNGDEFTFLDINDYNHLIYRINSNSFIVVSKPKGNFLELMTIFSWVFICISILALIVFIISGFTGRKQRWEWNFTRRVQASVLFLVVLTFILVWTGTVYYINRKYANDQQKSIADQVNAIWFMVNDNIFSVSGNGNDTLGQLRQLDRLVNNTNIDFNIFNQDGILFYSSQPKIFDKGIISDRINPGAFSTIKEKGPTQFIHPENVGRLKFIAAYAPFTDPTGNIIAFLNLPYFEKQNERNKDISVFLSALVNIYVLLFTLAVLVTVFISSQITRPLLLIREKMSGIRLGAINEKISYSENDEIGQLVHEYNRMIDELSISANKLARSERETAWREMARQVAHEIKNPLTPMKLSVQHLQRTFKDKGYDDASQVDRISATLIQQIDTLSNIATAFSNFAQMPQPVPLRIDLKDVLNQVVQLYTESCEIKIYSGEEAYYVLADKDQLIGVFSNLLKNAVQSIPADRKGKIDISISRQDGFITIEIADNGIGIPEDQRDKIFIPNFTTKSSGMGLGLAIVRNIVEEAKGKIWFTSIYGKGSKFFLNLPEAS